jgi:hypothetical protein
MRGTSRTAARPPAAIRHTGTGDEGVGSTRNQRFVDALSLTLIGLPPPPGPPCSPPSVPVRLFL